MCKNFSYVEKENVIQILCIHFLRGRNQRTTLKNAPYYFLNVQLISDTHEYRKYVERKFALKNDQTNFIIVEIIVILNDFIIFNFKYSCGISEIPLDKCRNVMEIFVVRLHPSETYPKVLKRILCKFI